MPTYEYACGGCGREFEIFQNITEEPLKKCPACGRRRLRRLIGAGAGIIFKGSGFYETDYKRAGSNGGKKEPPGEKPEKTPAPAGETSPPKPSAASAASSTTD